MSYATIPMELLFMALFLFKRMNQTALKFIYQTEIIVRCCCCCCFCCLVVDTVLFINFVGLFLRSINGCLYLCMSCVCFIMYKLSIFFNDRRFFHAFDLAVYMLVYFGYRIILCMECLFFLFSFYLCSS